ncbi:MAG: hypothetical protein J2P53_01535 [Bradyrhizobiaceae bacterium]|nr:hypothetical protein [Bradyrhizobiaceae bacterium]
MLPDLKFLLCGILFCVLLFAAAGGVTLPDSRTHVGEMPEVGRPMMQQSMARASVKTPAYMTMIARHSDEPVEWEQTADTTAAGVAPPQAAPSGGDGLNGAGEPSQSDRVVAPPPGKGEADAAADVGLAAVAPRDNEPDEIAALLDEDSATVAPFVNVPLPPRRGVVHGRRHRQRTSRGEDGIVQHHHTAPSATGEGAAAAMPPRE